MPKTRREFSSEFKREAVALLESTGRPLMRTPPVRAALSVEGERRKSWG